jgi:hypothetical protein
MPWCKKG